jgi:hypothetical protein
VDSLSTFRNTFRFLISVNSDKMPVCQSADATLGPYEISAPIGVGGMQVYRARLAD